MKAGSSRIWHFDCSFEVLFKIVTNLGVGRESMTEFGNCILGRLFISEWLATGWKRRVCFSFRF